MLRPVRLLKLTALLAGVCACSTSSATRRPLPAHAVTLRFAWPEGFSARLSHRTIFQPFEGSRAMESHHTYWLREEPGPQQGQRRLVARREGEAASLFGSFVDPEITVLFDREGTFLGAEHPEQAAVMELLEALPLPPEEEEEARRGAAAALTGVAEERWHQRVGVWRGVTLVPGEPLRSKTTMWVGQTFVDREELEAEERISIEAGVPCTADDSERRCVRVAVDIEPVRPFQESDPCRRARAIKHFTLVTDPRTLLPYSVLKVREDEMNWCREDGTVSTRKALQAEEFTFTYGVEPAAPGVLSL